MGTILEEHRRSVQESVASLVAFADRDNSPGWRPIGGRGRYSNDPPMAELEKSRDFAFDLWLRNPLAYSIVEIMVSFVCGSGIVYQTNNRTQAIIDKFWKHPSNDLDLTMEMKVRALSLYGELCLPAFVSAGGDVTLGFVSSKQIHSILPDATNPAIQDKVVLRPKSSTVGDVDKPDTLQIIRVDTNPTSSTYGKLVGDCFYFSINRTPDVTRGISDLFSIADWLSVHDQVLFDRAERVAAMNTWFRDVEIQGASADEIKKFMSDERNTPSRSQREFVHNERIKANMLSPNLNASDAVDDAAMIKDHILAGSGFPDTWFASQSARSRSASAEMSEPTYRRIGSRQKYWREALSSMIRFAIEQYMSKLTIKSRGLDTSFKLNMPNISKRDIQRAGGVFGYIADFMEKAQTNDWLTKDEIRGVTKSLLAELGFEAGEAIVA